MKNKFSLSDIIITALEITFASMIKNIIIQNINAIGGTGILISASWCKKDTLTKLMQDWQKGIK